MLADTEISPETNERKEKTVKKCFIWLIVALGLTACSAEVSSTPTSGPSSTVSTMPKPPQLEVHTVSVTATTEEIPGVIRSGTSALPDAVNKEGFRFRCAKGLKSLTVRLGHRLGYEETTIRYGGDIDSIEDLGLQQLSAIVQFEGTSTEEFANKVITLILHTDRPQPDNYSLGTNERVIYLKSSMIMHGMDINIDNMPDASSIPSITLCVEP